MKRNIMYYSSWAGDRFRSLGLLQLESLSPSHTKLGSYPLGTAYQRGNGNMAAALSMTIDGLPKPAAGLFTMHRNGEGSGPNAILRYMPWLFDRTSSSFFFFP